MFAAGGDSGGRLAWQRRRRLRAGSVRRKYDRAGAAQYFLGGTAPRTDLQIASTVTNLTIQGAGEGQTAINASLLGNRVFEIAPGANVTIRDLTIVGGHAPDGSAGAGTVPAPTVRTVAAS